MFANLVARFGLLRVIGAGLLLVLMLSLAGKLGWTSVKAWYYEGKADHMEVQRDTARAETKVARKDEAQTARAAETTATTVAAQDQHAAQISEATSHATEVIDERIRQAPPAAVVPDDPVVRREADQAYLRAQAAEDRLRGTPRGDGAAASAPGGNRLSRLGKGLRAGLGMGPEPR